MATVRVNGELRELSGATLAAVLAEMGYALERKGTAVAVNGTVVPRVRWGEQSLAGGDEIEVVSAVQGG